MTSREHEVHYLDHGGGGYNYGVLSSEVTESHLQTTPRVKKKRTGASRIKVCVRKRPLSKREEKRETDVVRVDEDGQQLLVKEEKLGVDLRKVWLVHKFRFDEVFGEDISNKGVYERTAKHFLPFVLKGGKATCFAFGQTGAGKTHTLLGDQNGKGLYQFAVEDLFECLRAEAGCDGVVVWISYFEIYCGQLYDLLNKRERIQALENGKHQVCITGVNEIPVNGPQALNQFIEQGNSLRSQGSSGVNSCSSRSHAVLQIQLKDVTGNKLGRLSFIDLAGSERACDRGDPDKTTRLEGAEINTSLLALKECIRAMDQEHSHTPFRQSKLTQVLRDSFWGQSLTCMVASISPASSALEHTLNTLRYADRVKEIHRLAHNSHQFSSAPKNFTPNNTSTPLKPQRNVRTGSSSPRRTSLPAQNLRKGSTPDSEMTKRRSSMQQHSPRVHGTLKDKVRSELKGSPLRKVKQGSKRNLANGGNDMDKNHPKQDQSYNEKKGKGPLVASPAIHHGVVNGEAENLMSNRRRPHHQEKDGVTMSNKVKGQRESFMKGEVGNSDQETLVTDKKTVEERSSGNGEVIEEEDEEIRRQKMVRSFLSNSLPVWENEKVEQKVTPSPNLSIGWEIENPHYIETRESVRIEGGKGEQEINNNNSKEFDVMRFENPRYVGRKSNPQLEFTGVEEKFEGENNVKSHQSFQSLTDHFAREVISKYDARDGGKGPEHPSGGEEREGAGSPRSIATDSTMELLAEIDHSLRNSSVSPVPDLARRYTLDGMSHGDLLKDVSRLKMSSSFTEKVSRSTEYQKTITKTQVKKRKENVFHQKGEVLRKISPEIEQRNRGHHPKDNLPRKGTPRNDNSVDVKDGSRKEQVGQPEDAERNENRSGEDGSRGTRDRHPHDEGQRENENRQDRKYARSKDREKVREVRKGNERVRRDAHWEMKQQYVAEDREVGISRQPQKEPLTSSTSDQDVRYSHLCQYDTTRNKTERLPHSISNSKTGDFEGNKENDGWGWKRDGGTGALQEKAVDKRGNITSRYDRDNSHGIHQGIDGHGGPHRSDLMPADVTIERNFMAERDGETHRMPVERSSTRHGINEEGNVEKRIRNSRESSPRAGEDSGVFVRQNNPQNHQGTSKDEGSAKGIFKDIFVENGNEQVIEVLSGRHHSHHVSHYEEIINQSGKKNNSTNPDRRAEEPSGQSIDEIVMPRRRTIQNDVEPEKNVSLVDGGTKHSRKMDLGEEVESEGKVDLNQSHNHNPHNTGEWCECCSVLEQKQLWNKEETKKHEEGMTERLGRAKEEKQKDLHRRASLNQESESPSRRRRNVKQRHSLPWIGAPTFTNQKDLGGRVNGSEPLEDVMGRSQGDGQVDTKENDHSAAIFTSSLTIHCVGKLSDSGKEARTVGTPSCKEIPEKKVSLAKESSKPGESESVKGGRNVCFEDVRKRELERREEQHHPLPSVLVTPDDTHRDSPRCDAKEKPSSPDLTVYSTGGYIPTVFAVAQNNDSVGQLNNNLSQSGKKKKKKKSLKEKMSEKGIESLPSPKGFPPKTEMARSIKEGNTTRNEVSCLETSLDDKAVTTWAESARRQEKSKGKEERDSFFLWDVEGESPMTSRSQCSESTLQQVAFYRETFQPISNQWQHVRNDGRSPVVKVKLPARNCGKDFMKDEEVDGILKDRSKVITDKSINKSFVDINQNKFSEDMAHQDGECVQSWKEVEEVRKVQFGDVLMLRMEEKFETVRKNADGKNEGDHKSEDSSVTPQRLDFGKEERVQSWSKEEHEDRRKFEERNEVLSKRDGRETSQKEDKDTHFKKRTSDVTDLLDDGNVKLSNQRSKLSEGQKNKELVVEEFNSPTQQKAGVTNLEVDNSWVGHQPLSPIPENRSDEEDGVRGRPISGKTEDGPTQGDHIRPSSALEKATEHSNLFSRVTAFQDRHLLVKAHQDQLEELQQLCDSGWNLINKLQLGQGDVYEYLSDSDILLDSQQRCIKTFKDQLAMYTSCSSPAGMMMNGFADQTNGWS